MTNAPPLTCLVMTEDGTFLIPPPHSPRACLKGRACSADLQCPGCAYEHYVEAVCQLCGYVPRPAPTTKEGTPHGQH